jgi:TolB protein
MTLPASRMSRRSFLAIAGLALLGSAACAPVSSALPVASGVSVQGPAPNPAGLGIAQPAVRQANPPPGRILYVRDGNLWLWERGASHQFSEGGTWSQPAFSPGGKEIAYVFWAENFSDLFAMAADGSRSRRLTRNQAGNIMDNSWAFRPAWSPDGERIAFVSDANSRFPQLWLVGQDGANRRQLSLPAFYEESWVDALTWDPGGTRLAVTGAPDMRVPSQIYLVNVAKETAEKLTTHTNGAFDPSWSPDGSALAYIGRPGSLGELRIRTIGGEKEGQFDKLSYVRSPAWSPDGKSVAVLAQQNGAFEVFVLAVKQTDAGFEIGEPRQLTRDAAVDPMAGLTWAP